MPAARDYDDEIADTPWFSVAENDIFPEEFRKFLWFPAPLRKVMDEHHGRLFTVEFWRGLQERTGAGEMIDFFPYDHSKRFTHAEGEERLEWRHEKPGFLEKPDFSVQWSIMDTTTTLGDLRHAVHDFVAERDWYQYHTPKNLAMSIAIEAAEIMEHFQWLSLEESRSMLDDERVRAEVADELADVLIYCLSFANASGIDLSTAVMAKLERNQGRFPVERVRGHLGHTHGDGILDAYDGQSSAAAHNPRPYSEYLRFLSALSLPG